MATKTVHPIGAAVKTAAGNANPVQQLSINCSGTTFNLDIDIAGGIFSTNGNFAATGGITGSTIATGGNIISGGNVVGHNIIASGSIIAAGFTANAALAAKDIAATNSISAHDIVVVGNVGASILILTPGIFVNLPGSPVEGMVAAIQDATVSGFGANVTVGGGTHNVMVRYNGTKWTVCGA